MQDKKYQNAAGCVVKQFCPIGVGRKVVKVRQTGTSQKMHGKRLRILQ